jgi:hypothetical protein
MFDPTSLTREDIRQHIITLRQQNEEHRFIIGELMHYAVQLGETVGQLAYDNNCSAAYVRHMIKVWSAFPTEEARLPFSDLTFQHYKLAAYSNDPIGWLEQAGDKALWTRELRKAINGSEVVDELKEADRVYGKVERCFQAGGQGASYLHERLTKLIREVEPDDFYTGAEASEASTPG